MRGNKICAKKKTISSETVIHTVEIAMANLERSL